MIWTPERQKLALESCDKWHGTPHRNRIAIPGVGVDCIKFVHEILYDSGVVPRVEYQGYDLEAGMWGPSDKLQHCILQCVNGEVVQEPYEFGDILLFKTGRRSAHCGFYVPDYIWHSLAHRQVTKSDFPLWRKEIECGIRITSEGLKTSPANIDLK